ncbi:hypothetical protein FRC01_003536 [Tulasnella sp. 417]|nr:hypothetical protein FRC01_003536 [Tulasnella sp. 417]
MHLSPALVSLPIFALPLIAAPIPSPRPDALTGNGGNAYTGAAGDASGGDSNCGGPGDLLGLGLFSGNTGNGGDASSGNAYAGNGGNINGLFGPDFNHNSNQPEPAPVANNPADNNPSSATAENRPVPNENAAQESYPDPKTYIGKPKGKPKGSKPKNAKPKIHAAHPRPQSDIEGDNQSNSVYVAGNGGDATSGPGGQAISGPANASSGSQNVNSGTFDDSGDFIDVDALNSSLNDASALNGALGHDNGLTLPPPPPGASQSTCTKPMVEKASAKKAAPTSSAMKTKEQPAVQKAEPPSTNESTFRSLAKIASQIVSLGLATYACQVALHPLYGEVTTSQNFNYVMAGSLGLSMFLPTKPSFEGPLIDVLAVIFILAPRTIYTWGAKTARWGDPFWGPIAAQLPVAVPILIIGALLMRIHLFALLGVSHQSRFYRSVAFISTFSWIRVATMFIESKVVPGERGWATCDIFLAWGIASSVGNFFEWFRSPASFSASPEQNSSPTKFGKSAIIKFAFTALQASAVFTTRTARPCSTIQFPYTTGKNETVKILAQKQSVTGLVQVAEDLDTGFRYMRCDHSLLGGVWVGEERIGSLKTTRWENPPAGGTDLEGVKLGDPIYSAFMLQDAMRLFERGPDAPPPEGQSALIIGLGAGIMARALDILGISATVVEIDPAVHEYAYRFFNLTGHPPFPRTDPHPETIHPRISQSHHMDGRKYVQDRANFVKRIQEDARLEQRYDYVVHDVFTGGSVPAHLFTKEMWDDVKTVMRPDGILAVNFAGYLVSDASRSILTTLEESFELCRIFHDRIEEVDSGLGKDNEFINMVFFCTQSPSIELSIREPEDKDFVNSHLKRYLFTRFEKLEVPSERILGSEFSPARTNREDYILTDQWNLLAVAQQKTAVDHWKLMREVLPAETWEAY